MNNHIDQLEIVNFKSIRHQKIEGCKRINVFIGYPNVGKSAILEAIASLAYLEGKFNKPFNALCRVQSPSELFFDGTIRKNIEIKCNDKVTVTIFYGSEEGYDVQVEENKVDLLQPNMSFGRNFAFRNHIIHQVSSNDWSSSLVVKKYTFLNEFNAQMTNGKDLDFPFGANLVDIVQFYKPLRKEVGELFRPYGLRLLFDQSNNALRGMKQLDEDTVFSIPFYQMADTLQRLIFHKAAIMSNTNTVLLFEEPEAHMFPPYISKFTADVIYEKSNGNQYFINTHSPFVLNELLENAQDELSVYVVGMKDGETMIRNLNAEEMQEISQYGIDLFFNIESYLP